MYDKCKERLARWMSTEYAHDPPLTADDVKEDENGNIPIAYTTLGDNEEYQVQVYVNLHECAVRYQLTDENGQSRFLSKEEEKYESLESLFYDFLEWLDFNSLISPFYDYVETE